ncbi:hypothetical protein B5M10_03925 [Pluralibacter gergoviae]|uniref:PAAR domain-containing protein n=1 Tax=Pluralibacter gergoviae TaxID=61647 RepID=UPI0005ED1FBD|nr:PAAR domain-containing protein [Pluralibacter gergoviae]KJM55628.1 PAAR repeat-containing protein [Pluralibacter gergoviae]OUR04082.1 hypothetical protein B5M10_03925 [Pluralibacter gergoviae]
MSGLQAARVDDEISHTASKGWMIAGLIGGAILGGITVVATGGTALIAISAAAAGGCAAGGLGEVLGSMSWAPRHVTGTLKEGSSNVFINSRRAIRAHLSTGECEEHSGSPQRVAEGSSKVYINNYPAARVGDLLTCSAEITQGSRNVLIGGSKTQTDEISPEIPAWVNWTMLAVGAGALAVVAGPAVALLSTLGAGIGGTAGDYVGGALFGQGSDGQKWSMLAGSLVGGGVGMKGGAKFNAWRAERTNGVPISKSKYDEVIRMPKEDRPDPDSYLPKKYIEDHGDAFSNGASRIVVRSSYEDYGVGKPDLGKSEFVLTKDNALNIINESKQDPSLIAERLGIPKEQLSGDSLVIIEFKPTELYSPRIPSGREWGANEQWLPGGKLPQGDLEAVVSTEGMVNGRDYIVRDLITGEVL